MEGTARLLARQKKAPWWQYLFALDKALGVLELDPEYALEYLIGEGSLSQEFCSRAFWEQMAFRCLIELRDLGQEAYKDGVILVASWHEDMVVRLAKRVAPSANG